MYETATYIKKHRQAKPIANELTTSTVCGELQRNILFLHIAKENEWADAFAR